jgi:hypothetical protein
VACGVVSKAQRILPQGRVGPIKLNVREWALLMLYRSPGCRTGPKFGVRSRLEFLRQVWGRRF